MTRLDAVTLERSAVGAETQRRLPRYERAGIAGVSLRLQDRDREILKLVYEHRLLTSRAIQRLATGSEQAILRRLQKLFHGGYLDRVKTPVHQACVYGLGNRGADELVVWHGMDRKKIDWTTKNREAKTQFVLHTLMISNFRATLQLALGSRPGCAIPLWAGEGALKDAVRIQEKGQRSLRVPVIPDGSFTLVDQDDILFFMLECDRSTMSNDRFFRKLRGYWRWWQTDGHRKHGIEDFRVLTITKSEARKENLRRVAKGVDDDRRGSTMFWFTSEREFAIEEPASVLGRIWQTPADDAVHELLE